MSNRTRTILSIVALAAVSLSSSAAFADGVGTVAKAKEQTRKLSVTIDPVHLFLPEGPIYQVMGEFRAEDQWSVAAIAGGGALTNDANLDYAVWQVGGQFDYYLVGNFDHGMQVGGQLLYHNASFSDDAPEGAVAPGTGFRIAPFVGYKLATELGITFNAQAGVQYSTADALENAPDPEGAEIVADPEGEAFSPMLRLNVGWSF